MRNVFAGLVAVSLMCGVTLAQNAPRDNQGTQPAGQGQTGQVGQGQVAPAQPVQPGQAIQPGRAVQGQPVPAQPGQPTIRPGVVGQPVQPLQGGQRAASGDQEIACCVYGECHNEIEIAKFAESKAKNDEVREFAQRMVRDHSPGCQEMQQLAGQLASDSHQPQAASSGGHLDWISIKKQIGQQCLKSVKEELGSKQGEDFDKCFMGQQIGAHMKVVDELTVLRNHASSELKQKLDKELETAKQHLQLAKQIEQKLKDRPSERVSRRPESK